MIGGRYVVLGDIDSAAAGSVCRAADRVTGRQVAVAELHRRHGVDVRLGVGVAGVGGLAATAVVASILGAAFGSSEFLINGPTNAISIALLAAIGAVPDQAVRIQLAILMAFLIGVIQIAISMALNSAKGGQASTAKSGGM